MRVVFGCFVFSLFSFTSQQALAFDCAKASTDTEKTICAQPALKAADDAMSAAYESLFNRLKPAIQDQLKISQINFIASREYCGSGESAVICALDKTISRIQFLNGGVEAGALTGPMPALEPLLLQREGDDKKGLIRIDYSAIRFSNPATDGEKAFNAAMEKTTERANLEPQPDMTEFSFDNPWEQSSDTRITLLNDTMISAETEFYSFEGGAHGNGGVSSVSFDRKSGAPINVAAALGKEGVEAFISLCREQIIAVKAERQANYDPDNPYDITKDDFYTDDTVRTVMNEADSWRLEPGKATVTFNNYVLGAYAEGSFECVFAAELLSAMTGGKLNLR
jgi:uncharacterized protein YecT (DUF1311 family)